MQAKGKAEKHPTVRDAAVQANAGRPGSKSPKTSESARAKKAKHKPAPAPHRAKHRGPTVAREPTLAVREKYPSVHGHELSVSQVITVPVAQLYQAWANEAVRSRWLPKARVMIHKATENRSMLLTWRDGDSYLDVSFSVKGKSKSQVTVNHTRLASPAAAARMKRFWIQALEHLKRLLEVNLLKG